MLALKAHDLEIRRGPRFHLGPLSFELRQGNSLHVIGKNGSGKTSLMLCLIGKIKAHSGNIDTNHQRSGFVGLAPYLFHSWTVKESQKFVEGLTGLKVDESQTLNQFADRQIQELSQGQKRAVELEIMLGLDLKLYFLDEAFTHLDTSKRSYFIERIEKKRKQACSFVVSFHEKDEWTSPFEDTIEL